MKCSFCRSCLKIIRVEINDEPNNYLVCFLCGRIYYNNLWQAVEVVGDEGDLIRSCLGLTKVGNDESAGESH